MRLIGFGNQQVGVLRGSEVVELTDLVDAQPTWPPTAMVRLIAEFTALRDRVEERLASAAGVPSSNVRLTAPIQWPNKLIAFPTNYEDHVQEMHSSARADRSGFFLKAPSSICGPHDVIELPQIAPDREIHHEAELGIVLAKTGRNIRADEALEYVSGYTCLMDMTVRGIGERVMRKSFDTFTPIGPAIVTSDEVPNPGSLAMELRVNGEIRQSANTSSLILGVQEMVELVSSVVTIYPGDVIASGTPGGVGPVHPGDQVTMTIEGLGTLSLPVVQGTSGRNVALDALEDA